MRPQGDKSGRGGLELPSAAQIAAYHVALIRGRMAEGRYPVLSDAIAEAIITRDNQRAEQAGQVQTMTTAQAQAIHIEVLALVADACSRLPEVEALVLQLSMVEELSVSEIGAILSESPDYVHSLRKIGLGRLRLMIGDVAS